MRVKIEPSLCHGHVAIPCSKSLAHRAIICASLSRETSVITNLTMSKDLEATIQSMQALGASIQIEANQCTIRGTTHLKNNICDCNESGSTLRFLLPIVALSSQTTLLKGSRRLLARPLKIYEKIFKQQNLKFEKETQQIKIQGPLQADTFIIPGNISSQFITGFLLACPLLKEDSTIQIIPPFESKSYVDLTIFMLKKFNIKILHPDSYTYIIPGNQTYRACDYRVEEDYSQYAFFAVLNHLQGNHLQLPHMKNNSLQGDKKIIEFIKNHQNSDLADCPDLGPILCVLDAFSEQPSRIFHVARLRYKECDRIQAMEDELKKWDVCISSQEDEITIQGKSTYQSKKEIIMNGHNDHRIVMACTVFALCSQSPSIIEGAEAVAKSYPNFFKDLIHLGAKISALS